MKTTLKKSNSLLFQVIKIENPSEMLKCFSPSLVTLSISGEYTKELNFDIIRKFDQLFSFTVENMRLTNFDLNVISNSTAMIDISDNNLQHISNVQHFRNLKKLFSLHLNGNQLENVMDIIKNLESRKLIALSLCDIYVGKLNASTFADLKNIRRLYLKNTSLSFYDLTPFEPFIELVALDISHNNLENVRFTPTPGPLKTLFYLSIAHCGIANVSEWILQTSPRITTLDISGNDLNGLNLNTFAHLERMYSLKMSRGNLSDLDFNLLRHQSGLNFMDLSYNKLETINFTLHLPYLHNLYLQGNELTEVINLTKTHMPELRMLDISRNQFSCEYLDTFVPQIKREFPHLELAGNTWEQKHGVNCVNVLES